MDSNNLPDITDKLTKLNNDMGVPNRPVKDQCGAYFGQNTPIFSSFFDIGTLH